MVSQTIIAKAAADDVTKLVRAYPQHNLQYVVVEEA